MTSGRATPNFSGNYKANTRINGDKGRYAVVSDAPSEVLKDAALWVFTEYMKFALGLRDIQGYRIKNPTGRLASAARIETDGMNKWAVIVDEKIAPEAEWIEKGHRSVDLKTKPGFWKGRHLPLHRAGGQAYAKGHSVPGYRGHIGNWTVAAYRENDFSGMATVGTTGWVIPPMKASHALQILNRMAAARIRQI